MVHEPAEVLGLEGDGEEGDEGEEVGHVRFFRLHVGLGEVKDVVEPVVEAVQALYRPGDIHLNVWSCKREERGGKRERESGGREGVGGMEGGRERGRRERGREREGGGREGGREGGRKGGREGGRDLFTWTFHT